MPDSSDVIITREIASFPPIPDDAHKGELGRVVVIGGCCAEVLMAGAPALAANAALRSGAGLVQMLVPEPIRCTAATLAPCATTRTLPTKAADILGALKDFQADALVVGPGLGRSMESQVLADVLQGYEGPVVVDADGLKLLATAPPCTPSSTHRIVLTPHPGEMRTLLEARDIEATSSRDARARREAALAIVKSYGCTVVLKGNGTIVTNGDRLYVNVTGNAGLATAGTGDVLGGMIGAFLARTINAFEAAILGVYLHGLAGDFAAEELGRRSMIATDVIEYLPEAFAEHELTND